MDGSQTFPRHSMVGLHMFRFFKFFLQKTFLKFFPPVVNQNNSKKIAQDVVQTLPVAHGTDTPAQREGSDALLQRQQALVDVRPLHPGLSVAMSRVGPPLTVGTQKMTWMRDLVGGHRPVTAFRGRRGWKYI